MFELIPNKSSEMTNLNGVIVKITIGYMFDTNLNWVTLISYFDY